MSSHRTHFLVAFDTIFEQCSIAILQNDVIIYDETVAGGRGQTEIILPMLDKALQSTKLTVQDINAWAFNRGPGAFSGIRINTAVVQALSVANDAPCIGISSLHALAFMAYEQECMTDGTRISAVMDARQNQVYAGNFVIQSGRLIADNECLLDYGVCVQADVVVGDGVDLVATNATKLRLNPTACHIARLACLSFLQGDTLTADNALPVYLRNNAWKTLAEQGKK
ncbi:MAG: tRNA (adenosine(37)-N6)-threonylcarbamoyltransferase complex dimerization subunit type 1 TsaB [Moraxella sp.]|nr:tRNA (adenosine(37)-N6)-threonylcarbamoyltransferase complex dimerization subunit type 1 TsaB [Moraxella sp.]